MRLSQIFMLLAVICLSSVARPESLDLARRDHQLHLAAGYALSYTGMNLLKPAGLLEAAVYSSLLTMGAEFVKEYAVDKRSSRGDFMATSMGVGIAAGIFISTEFLGDG